MDRFQCQVSSQVSFPYVRQVGVKGETVTFEVGEENEFLGFLRTKKAALLWTDSEDLQLLANLYQMSIKIITTKGDQDQNPTVNWVGPDPDMKAYKMLPEGAVPDMTLMHYENQHYNLVISKDCDLAKYGTLSQWLDNMEETKEETEEDEEQSIESKLKSFTTQYNESQIVIAKLLKRIKSLETELKKKKEDMQEHIDLILSH